MNKELIDMNVNRAIVSINDKFDYQEARRYLDAALNEVGSNKKLAYYDVLKRVINKLQYNVRGFSKKRRVKECFSNLLHFYGNEFPNIAYADVNPDSEIEMDLANSICCEVINAVGSFTKSMRALYIDFGLLTAVANNSKFLNEFMPMGSAFI